MKTKSLLILSLFFLFCLICCTKKNENSTNSQNEQSIENQEENILPKKNDLLSLDEIKENQEFLEQEEKIAKEISLLENENNSLNNENSDEKIIQKQLIEKNGNLSLMEFGNEIFIPAKTENGYLIIHSNDKIIKRFFYDFLFRTIKIEEYKNTNSEKLELLKTTENWFLENSFSLVQRKIETPEFIENFTYNENNLVSKIQKNRIVKFKEKNENGEEIEQIKNVPFQNKEIIYFDDNSIKNEKITEFLYKNDDFLTKPVRFEKEYKFTKNIEEIPSDFEYFENSVLKMKNKYSVNKGEFTSQVFFENNFSVKSYYENNLKVRDVFMKNNEVTREVFYEN